METAIETCSGYGRDHYVLREKDGGDGTLMEANVAACNLTHPEPYEEQNPCRESEDCSNETQPGFTKLKISYWGRAFAHCEAFKRPANLTQCPGTQAYRDHYFEYDPFPCGCTADCCLQTPIGHTLIPPIGWPAYGMPLRR